MFGQACRVTLVPLILLTLVGCKAGVNRSLSVADGESVDGGLNTVNGSVRIGRDARVGGTSRSVNGGITVGESSVVGGLSTVNGSIHVAEDVTVEGDLGTINGGVESGRGTKVEGDVSTINGRLTLEQTEIRGSVSTHNGDITLSGGRIGRDIVIEGRDKDHRSRELEIRIVDGAVVEGDVIVEDEDRKVVVYLEDGGEVKGQLRGADLVR